MLRKEINILVRERKGELRKGGKIKQLEKKYNIRRKFGSDILSVSKEHSQQKCGMVEYYHE